MSECFGRNRAIIDADAFVHNLKLARQLAPKAQLMAVVKANAYGHSIQALKPALAQADQLAVIDVPEAKALRKQGLEQPVVVLQGANNLDDLAWCVQNNAAPIISEPKQAQLLTQQPLQNFWLKLDTGMHRLGLNAEQLDNVLTSLKQVGLSGPYSLMTHFACADCDADFTQQQMEQFEAMAQTVAVEQRSLANSAALIDFPASHGDVIRPGIMLYGSSPFADRSAVSLGLKPVMSLQAKVAAIQTVSAGEGVGYGLTWRAERDCRVAVISAGYGDGVPRNLPLGTKVAVGAVEATIVGRVSMDSCFALLPESDDNVQVGHIATLWGQHTDGRVYPADEVAAACGTIGYELLTRVTSRVVRVPRNELKEKLGG